MTRETGRDRGPVVAFTGGGTAGHVFPGIAVAEEVARSAGARVFWIGSRRGVEEKLVADAGIDFRAIPAGKLRRYLSPQNLVDVARVLAGMVSALRILRRERPSLLFSKGGFVSVPPVVAAWVCRIPSFTHESDLDPGLATRINLRFSEKVLLSFPETMDFLPPRFRGKAAVTGNPVRAVLFQADPARGRRAVGCDPRMPLLLVVGGSLGSSFLNGLIASSVPRLSGRFFVVHQMGDREYAPSRAVGYYTAPFFFRELPDIMAAADLVISRAGANVLAEIATLGKPSLLIPLPASASRGDQIRNAEAFRKGGAALVIPQEKATATVLCSAIISLFEERPQLEEMGRRARMLARADSAEAIARLIAQRIA